MTELEVQGGLDSSGHCGEDGRPTLRDHPPGLNGTKAGQRLEIAVDNSGEDRLVPGLCPIDARPGRALVEASR